MSDIDPTVSPRLVRCPPEEPELTHRTTPLFTPQSDQPGLSLLSLSIAAANATPIALAMHSDSFSPIHPSTVNGGAAVNGPQSATPQGTTPASGTKQHRRLASTGKARRRLSDARDAATRPSCVSFLLLHPRFKGGLSSLPTWNSRLILSAVRGNSQFLTPPLPSQACRSANYWSSPLPGFFVTIFFLAGPNALCFFISSIQVIKHTYTSHGNPHPCHSPFFLF